MGQLYGSRGTHWSGEGEDRGARRAGNEEDPRRPRMEMANSSEMPLLRWTKEEGERLGSCVRTSGTYLKARESFRTARGSSSSLPMAERGRTRHGHGDCDHTAVIQGEAAT